MFAIQFAALFLVLAQDAVRTAAVAVAPARAIQPRATQSAIPPVVFPPSENWYVIG